MFGENEENNINEKGQKIPYDYSQPNDSDLKKEALDEEVKRYANEVLQNIKGSISWNEIVSTYLNASSSERVEIEGKIHSLCNNEADAIGFINSLKKEAEHHDLANSISDKISEKLR